MASEGPALSIVIPAFNASETLSDTLECLEAQTRSDWEAIVVDDGSTDGTVKVAQRFVDRDSRIRLLRQANGGVSKARNAGLADARGEWVAFLDSDDWITPEFCERMLTALRANPGAELAYCAYRRVSEDGRQFPMSWSPRVAARPFDVFARQCGVAVHCVVVKRDLVVAVGGFDTGLKTCEDWDLWQRIARTGAQFVPVPEALSLYRTRHGSLSHDVSSFYANAVEVMERGARSDPRVANPDKRYAQGLKPVRRGNIYIACWLAGTEFGAGRDGSALFAEPGAAFDWDDDIESAGSSLLEGFEVGRQMTSNEILANWSSVEPSVRDLFDRLAATSAIPRLSRRLMAGFERGLLRGADLGEPMTLTTTMGITIDLLRFEAVCPPEWVDSVLMHLRAGTKSLGRIEVPVRDCPSVVDSVLGTAEEIPRLMQGAALERVLRDRAKRIVKAVLGQIAIDRSSMRSPRRGGLSAMSEKSK